jgi:hypothetical protein
MAEAGSIERMEKSAFFFSFTERTPFVRVY